MPGHASLMMTLQKQRQSLREALSSQDADTFEERCEVFFSLAREDPTKSEEVYTKLLQVIQDYPAIIPLLLEAMPALSNDLSDPSDVPPRDTIDHHTGLTQTW